MNQVEQMDRIEQLIKELDSMIIENKSGKQTYLLAEAKCIELAALMDDIDNVNISDETFDGLSNITKCMMVGSFFSIVLGLLQNRKI